MAKHYKISINRAREVFNMAKYNHCLSLRIHKNKEKDTAKAVDGKDSKKKRKSVEKAKIPEKKKKKKKKSEK